MSILETGSQLLAELRRRSSSGQAEVFCVEAESRLSEWSEGEPENEVLARQSGAGVRLIDGERQGFSATNRLDSDARSALIERVIAGSQLTAPDAYLGLPETSTVPADDRLDLVDSSLSDATWRERAEFLSRLESEVRRRDPRLTKVLRASYREGRSQVGIVNSHGLAASYEGTSVTFSIACVAVEKAETQIGYGFQSARHYADLKPGWVVEKAVEGALTLLGATQTPSGRQDLVLDPWVAAEMLELFAGAVQADQVLKGKSFFSGKIGQQVGAVCLTLVDNGRLPRGLGSSPFDSEGCPTQQTVLLKDGVLQAYLYDTYTARRGKARSTGNAGRGSYKGVPGPDPTNFYLEPGAEPPDALIAKVQKGIYVRNVMGLHTVDTISGDYSLGLMGQRIENGRLTHGVRGVTMAGNLLDLFKNVAAVGSDLTFAGSVGSPTLWIRDVSVGGAS
jgi:PmbA protein